MKIILASTGFALRYLHALLARVGEARLESASEGSPGRFVTSDPNETQVIMPRRV
jgi:hypothetical protein